MCVVSIIKSFCEGILGVKKGVPDRPNKSSVSWLNHIFAHSKGQNTQVPTRFFASFEFDQSI